eukprot:CAMPEP_0176032130 /NCGR_PEP_ID=MMETSP0120_2-20121206/15855_1 /TAXON_ID=160619 /ORGANISM="Kryptoperidinium foliaceum, Strain CCMP 1326" /LENGTH=205 /DNA_ID=CAMNT_0017365443 /DNA_START=153 /DNA_END=770 /DNA_ORIENTATION=+
MSTTVLALVALSSCYYQPSDAYTVPYSSSSASRHVPPSARRSAETSATSMMMTAEDAPDPTSFREAEVLGLRLMQEGNFQEALTAFQKGMKLPGSRPDVVRTKALSGPSPVGGAFGGTESQPILALDDFELQAAHYNMACAHARLGNLDDSIANLAKAFENGFDNYSTVRGDPDLDPIKQQPDFLKLMDSYETKGFNPFGFFGKK